jgi:hypothetical protein
MTVVATIEAHTAHPAVRAWMQLDGRIVPSRIEQFKAKKTSSVYRLVGARDGVDIVAKRRSKPSAHGLMVERTVYEQILPCTGVPSVRYLGMVDDEEDASTWLFVEDGGGRYYAPDSAVERRALGTWLGLLHTKGTAAAERIDLPDRGPGPFRKYLAHGKATISEHRGNPALDDREQTILRELLELMELLDSTWRGVEEFCASMPRVFVHGDLIARNICMRVEDSVLRVLTIDWEKSGWGIPSMDLAQAPLSSPQFSADADVDTYWDVVQDAWPRLSREALQHSAWYGTIFRCLIAVHWDAPYLRLDWPHRTMAKMEYYCSALRRACREVGIGDGA